MAENVLELFKTLICFTSGDISYLAGIEGVCFERNKSRQEITEQDQQLGRKKREKALSHVLRAATRGADEGGAAS